MVRSKWLDTGLIGFYKRLTIEESRKALSVRH